MKIRSSLICLVIMLTLTATAQKRKAAPVTVLTPEEIAHQEKLDRMMAATQKVMFIDSVVVDKDQFLQYYNLNPESGKIARYQDFFPQSKRNPNCYVFKPVIDNKEYFSQENNVGDINLYCREKTGKLWSRGSKIPGINDDKRFKRVNYPFLMGDGRTIYFAADGPEGLGGYDIYVARFDAKGTRVLKPENIGMPFNSEANDYMYVIDEYDSLGWFATDRSQPEGKVCIYTFVPPSIRQTYDDEEYTPEQISKFARIHDIAATWDDKSLLEAAQARIRLADMRKKRQTTGREFTFVINDDIVYTRLSEFREPRNRNRYQQLMALRDRYNKIINSLNRLRADYHTAEKADRKVMRPEFIASEETLYKIDNDIHQLEKTIRNAEIIYLKQKKVIPNSSSMVTALVSTST